MIAYGPLVAILPQALADLANRDASYAYRLAASRAIGLVLREMPLLSEQVKTDILVAVRACIADPEVVSQLMAALRDPMRDDPRWPVAITRLADAALDVDEEQTFHVLVAALIAAPTFSGALPARWTRALLHSRARRAVVLITDRYARRFGASLWRRA
jgi:hypothetical protein